ncbi:hypothetical protein HD806DRAFT_529418 [Xylariaceae sp. AK1471]|nr:hypothetical protein HD806DRAFT_529418 [Xylariaceae sp. AK1471]
MGLHITSSLIKSQQDGRPSITTNIPINTSTKRQSFMMHPFNPFFIFLGTVTGFTLPERSIGPEGVIVPGANGFTIPEGQPDGLYQVDYDSDGQAVHTLLRGPITAAERINLLSMRDPEVGIEHLGSLVARQGNNLACKGYDLDHQNTDNAVELLKNQCNPGAVGTGRDFYSIAFSTVAYFCNLSGIALVCTRDQLTGAFLQITETCGLYRAGSSDRQENGNRYIIGYEDRSINFCGRGVNGRSV